MAMARPIVATNVSDLPKILSGCGWIVNPNDPAQLAGAIEKVLNAPGLAMEAGRAAREKCIEEYGWDSLEKTLVSVFQKYEGT